MCEVHRYTREASGIYQLSEIIWCLDKAGQLVLACVSCGANDCKSGSIEVLYAVN